MKRIFPLYEKRNEYKKKTCLALLTSVFVATKKVTVTHRFDFGVIVSFECRSFAMFYRFPLRVLTLDGSGFLKIITSPPLPPIRNLFGPTRYAAGWFQVTRNSPFTTSRTETFFLCFELWDMFFSVLLPTEWQHGRRVANQECPAEACWPLHLHSTDARRQRHCLCPAGCQGWVMSGAFISFFFFLQSQMLKITHPLQCSCQLGDIQSLFSLSFIVFFIVGNIFDIKQFNSIM